MNNGHKLEYVLSFSQKCADGQNSEDRDPILGPDGLTNVHVVHVTKSYMHHIHAVLPLNEEELACLMGMQELVQNYANSAQVALSALDYVGAFMMELKAIGAQAASLTMVNTLAHGYRRDVSNYDPD